METGLLCKGLQLLSERSGRNMKERNRQGFSQGPRSTSMRTSAGPWTQYLLAAGEAEAQDGEALFGMLASRFGEEQEQYEDQCRAALQMVEYAFDFMEGAFGDSQEMVIFITELNTSYDAVRFLEENPCERYYQYNRKLLFEDREEDIKRKLERLL